MNLPESWTDLKEFALWYKLNNFPNLFPENKPIYETDVSISIPVFRYKNYQVEFYIAKPGFISSKHFHPFEQLIIIVGGSGYGRKGTLLDENPKWMNANSFSSDKSFNIKNFNVTGIGQWHQIRTIDQGLYFYNCQFWPDPNLMSSAVVEYQGDSLGPIHDTIIKN
jgi:hypothetical protein